MKKNMRLEIEKHEIKSQGKGKGKGKNKVVKLYYYLDVKNKRRNLVMIETYINNKIIGWKKNTFIFRQLFLIYKYCIIKKTLDKFSFSKFIRNISCGYIWHDTSKYDKLVEDFDIIKYNLRCICNCKFTDSDEPIIPLFANQPLNNKLIDQFINVYNTLQKNYA